MTYRIPALVLGTALLLAGGAPLSAACSGGSGGGGYGGYSTGGSTDNPDPTYSTASVFSPQAPSTDAKSSRVLVVLQTHRAPLGIWDASLATLSKTMPFVKYEDSEAARFAEQWGIDSVPAVALCDREGNVIAATSAPVTANNIHHLLDQADQEQAELLSSLGALYQSAEKASSSHHVAKALENLALIQHYQGLPVCTQAATLQASLLQQGHEAIVQAEGAGDRTRIRSQLGDLVRTYRGTVVADEASKALHQLN
jgi:hypothetical protein